MRELPEIPGEEYGERWAAAQRLMADLGLDLLLAYADDRATFGAAHARWFADFPVHFEPCMVLLRPEGPPVLLTGPESDEYALLRGRIPDVRVLREFTHPDEDYPFSRIQGLADILAETADLARIRRVGMGAPGLISADLFQSLHTALPSAEWINVESALCSLRAVKSPAEIGVTRRAYAIAQAGVDAAMDAIAPGVTERAVAAAIESAMRRNGAEGTGIDTIVASGPNSRPILARSTFRTIADDDVVLLTIAPRVQGYHAAIGRPVFVGQPPAIVRAAFDAACRAQEACAAALRPGIEGRAVEQIGRQIMDEAGFGAYFLYSGVHSVGVIEFEPPIFGPSSPAVLAENMIISIDIPVFNAPWGGLRVEDGYLITATGAEHLHATPYLLRK